jgi:hypothetical protein
MASKVPKVVPPELHALALAADFERFGDVQSRLVENCGRFGEPRCGIFLQVKDLQVGNGGITRVHLVALGEERLGEIVSPTGFGTFDLDQGGAKRVRAGLSFATLETVGEVGHALVDLFFVAGITAEKKIIQVQAIEHDL